MDSTRPAPAYAWLLQVLEGTPDPATIDHLQRGLQRWINSAGQARRDTEGRLIRHRPLSLAACLGLHENPMRARLRLRDDWLRAAACVIEVEGVTRWGRSVALAQAVRAFSGHQWACWWHMSVPPPNAPELHRTLFFAFKAGGGAVPFSKRGLHKIVCA